MNKSKQIDILLVEDREEDGELTLMGLKPVTNVIKWVKDGQEAIDFLFLEGQYCHRSPNCNPKLILLDINLPKLNGLEVLKKVRSNPDTRPIPVVVLTTSKDDHDIFEAYNLGVNSYITKPVNFTEFSKTARDVGLYWLEINKNPFGKIIG